MDDLRPIEEFAAPQIALKKIMDEWTPKYIQIAFGNCTPLQFGELIYDLQCEYVGPDHKYFCSMLMAHFLDGLTTSI